MGMSGLAEVAKLVLKGMAMGMADVVPGVSGGTIAFITGVYDRLLHALSQFGPALVGTLRREGLVGCWRKVDGLFLISLFGGVLLSILTFSHLITWLLANHPVPVWSFFFGLILAAGVHMLGELRRPGLFSLLLLAVGSASVYLLNQLAPVDLTPSLWMLYLSGTVAISAMILPGVSGSFILLLLGIYPVVLEAVKSLDILTLGVFGAGCITGLLCFSRLLCWLLDHCRDALLSLLTGLMIGALGKVWPWQVETGLVGEIRNVLPWTYVSYTGTTASLTLAVSVAALGFALVFVLAWLGARTGADGGLQ